MLSIFTYSNYRKYIADYYRDRKAADASFSYQKFSADAGFSSKSFIHGVITGTRNLSSLSIPKLYKTLGLSKTEAQYFENLVFFNQADHFNERDVFYKRLDSIRSIGNGTTSAKNLQHDQFEYYSNWYNVAIRSLIDMFPFKNNYKKLASMVYPPIKPLQAKKSVALLERLNLIGKDSSGTYKITDSVLTTGKEVQSHAVVQFHINTMKLAENALKILPIGKRNVSGLTLGISKDAYKKVCQSIYKCQSEIIEITRKDKNSDGVYQLNFHLFPLSRHEADQGNS